MSSSTSIVYPRFRDLMQSGMADEGLVQRVYYGYRDVMASKTLRSDTTYVMVEDGGEGDAPNRTGQTRNKKYLIIVEIGVKWTNSEDSLDALLLLWQQLEDVMFEPENQHLIVDDERTVDLLNIFDVESGYLFGTDNPMWRWRRGVAAYDELYCQRSWE